MKLELIPLSPADEQRAWSVFSGSPIQHTLHNEIVRKILTLRDALEVADASVVQTTQSDLKAHRFLLGLLHRNDPLPTK